MNKALHGKHYYMELPNDELAYLFMDFIAEERALRDEKFSYNKVPNGTWVMFSEAKCEDFRGDKMIAWERVKRRIYKHKREMKG